MRRVEDCPYRTRKDSGCRCLLLDAPCPFHPYRPLEMCPQYLKAPAPPPGEGR